MVTCVTCGDELHPERARKYDYCTKPECRARNAKGLDLVAVGVNEAADQFLVLDERTRREMASGRVKKQPDVRSMRSTMAPRASQAPARRAAPARKARRARPQWSEAQENLSVIHRSMGMNPSQIATKLGVSEHLVMKILLSATARGRR